MQPQLIHIGRPTEVTAPAPLGNKPAPSAAPPAVRPPQPHVALYRRIATVFICLTVIVVLFGLYVVFSRGTVVVMSKQEEVKADFMADIAKTPGDGELSGGVFEEEKELSRTIATVAGAKVEAKAEGRVRIANALSRNQTLVATTRLLTADNVLFRIKDTVVVPAGGSVEVDAAADLPGKAGEVNEANFTIPGLNADTRKFFTVTVVKPFSGGEKDGRLVAQTDIDNAVEAAKTELAAQITEELRRQAKEAHVSTSGEALSFSTVLRDAKPPVGAEAESFELKVRVRGTGVFFDRAQLDKQISAKLKEQVPFDRKLLKVAEDATVTTVEKVDLAANRANLRIGAKGVTVLSPDAPALEPGQFAGVTVEAAESYINKITGVSSVSVKVSPFWAGRLPDIAEHIRVEVR